MQIENNRIVSLRYVMKNDKGEIMEDNTNAEAFTYVHGSGNLMPALEHAMTGLSSGDKKIFSISDKLLNGIFHFDVMIDDVRTATEGEISNGFPNKLQQTNNCGPEGCC